MRRQYQLVDKHSGVGVLDKAVAILDAVAARPRSLAELVEGTGLARPTVHRIAVALELHGWLVRDADGRFAIGPGLVSLTQPEPIARLRTAAAPILSDLREQTGESAQLYVRRADVRVCIAAAERSSGLRDSVPVGAELTMQAGSAAQILLAWTDEAPAREAAFTSRTLAEVRRRGWAQSIAEREAGVASVSAPVHDRAGAVVAAVSISGPIERMGRAPGRAHGAALGAAGRQLSRAIAG